MLKVYVTEMPKTNSECPFHSGAEPNCCTITNAQCCLEKETECKHLATFFIEDRWSENNDIT